MKNQVKLASLTLILGMSFQLAASAQSAFSAGGFSQANNNATSSSYYPVAGNYNQSNSYPVGGGNYVQSNANAFSSNYNQTNNNPVAGNYVQSNANAFSSNYNQSNNNPVAGNYNQSNNNPVAGNYNQSNNNPVAGNYNQLNNYPAAGTYNQPNNYPVAGNYNQSNNIPVAANYTQSTGGYPGPSNYSPVSGSSANYSQPSNGYYSQPTNSKPYPVAGNYTSFSPSTNYPQSANYVATNFSQPAPGYAMPRQGNQMQPHAFSNFMNPVQQNNAAISAYNTGVRLLNQKYFDESIKCFHETLRINPNFAHAHRALGLAYKGLHDYQKSLSEFRTELKMNPGDADSYYFAGHVALFQHNYSLAHDLYAHYLSIKSSGHEADSARTALEIMDKNFFHPAQDDYFAVATTPDLHRWQAAGSRPLKVYIADCSGVRGYKSEYLPILQNAFSEWANSTRIVQFEFINNINEADIDCAWVDERAKGSTEAGLTHRSTKASGAISHAHIDLYTFPDAKEAPGNLQTSARKVDLHEIGHALGLDHSNSIYDIMSPVAFPDGLDFPLSRRDINTMVAVYTAPASSTSNLTQAQQSTPTNSYSALRE